MPRRVAVESGRRTAAGSRRARIVTHAEYSRKRPKTTTSAEVGTTPASDAPASAPAYAGPDNCRSVYVCGGREYAQYQRPATERRIAQERLWGAEDGWAPQSWGAWWWPRD